MILMTLKKIVSEKYKSITYICIFLSFYVYSLPIPTK